MEKRLEPAEMRFYRKMLRISWVQKVTNMAVLKKMKRPLMDTIRERQWRQRGSVVRVGDLNAEDPGSNPRLGLLNEFILCDPRGKFTTLCK